MMDPLEKIETNMNSLSEDELKDTFMRIVDNSYMLITWPESQWYMDRPWFNEEAILDINNEVGSSYFIPTKYTL
jgi:hypothetical protein